MLYGHAYLAPSPYRTHEHFGSFYAQKDSLGNIIGLGSWFWKIPSEGLKPERRISNDFNTIYQINSQLAVSIAFYYGKMYNLFSFRYLEGLTFHNVPVATIGEVINEGKSIAYGGTVRLDYLDRFGNMAINCFAAFSYSDGKIGDNPITNTSKYILKVGFGVSYQNNINLYAKLQYRDKAHLYNSTFDNPIFIEPITYINITASAKIINTENFKLSLFSTITNLTNARYYMPGYSEFPLIPQDPIRINFGIKIDL